MAAWKSLVAAKRREQLKKLMGSRCAVCGATGTLHFDCIQRQGPAHHYMPLPERTRYYEKQHSLKNLQLLCPRCHSQKTAAENARLRRPHLRPVARVL
jgi:5-methylcytosine-specific restriction endonuclease McrA